MGKSIQDQELKILLKSLAGKSGAQYFETLIIELSNIMTSQYIFIGELIIESNSIKTIALCKEGVLQPNFEYSLKDTPCKNVMDDSFCFHQANVQNLFPNDQLLIDMNIQSYMGIPLHDLHGYPHAILVFLDEKQKAENFPQENSFLEILAIMIGTELSRIRAQKKLVEREEKFRVTLDSIVDAVIVTDEDGHIERMNSIAEKLTGFEFNRPSKNLLSEVLTIYDSITKEKKEFPLHRLLFEDKPISHTKNAYILDNNGDKKHISYSGAPIHNDEGYIIGSILILNDITQTHELEAQLHHSQKMESIGKLAGGIAHDFNNILGGILGCAELIKKKCPGNKTVETYTGHIIQAAERSAGLTRQLLDFSRQGKVHSASIDIHDLIKESASLLENTIDKRIKITQTLNAKTSSLLGDAGQIHNCILNLGINAADAISADGQINITTSNLDITKAQAAELNLPLPGGYLKIEVSDTGEGIDPKTLPHIFDPFFTTKNIGEGTGLGLAAVHGAIKDHLGSIQVTSQLKKGTQFTLYLPTLKPKPSRTASTTSDSLRKPQATKLEVKHILIVEDEELIRLSAQHLLKDLGYHVLLAKNGEEALTVYHQNKIDLMILDLVMPILNGADLFKKIRAIDHDLPILFSSGFSNDAKVASLMDHATHFIQKPYHSEALMEAIHHLVSK